MIIHPIYNNPEYLSELAFAKKYLNESTQNIQLKYNWEDYNRYNSFFAKYRDLQFYIMFKIINHQGRLVIRDLTLHDHNELFQTDNLSFIINFNDRLYGQDTLSTSPDSTHEYDPEYCVSHLMQIENITAFNRKIFIEWANFRNPRFAPHNQLH